MRINHANSAYMLGIKLLAIMIGLSIRGTQFKPNEALSTFISKKVNELDRLGNWIQNVDITLSKDRKSKMLQNKVVVLKVQSKLRDFFITSSASCFKDAVIKSLSKIRTPIGA